MPDDQTAQFETEWHEIADAVCNKIYQNPDIQTMKDEFDEKHTLSPEQRSSFIAIANKLKYEVIYEKFGAHDTQGYDEFVKRWRHWYDNKGVHNQATLDRKLTNAEHILYSSTPDPEEFLSNYTK